MNTQSSSLTEISQIDTSLLYDKKEEIRCFIQKLLSDKGKDTNYVNKRMQDSIVNFFLEDYVAPLFPLSKSFDSTINRKQFHKNILNNIKQKKETSFDSFSQTNIKYPKYVQLLSEYLELLQKDNLINEYKQMLIKTILMDESQNKENCITLLWRKQLCILLLEHSINPQLKTIYLMWNAAYPQNLIYNKKESYYRKNMKQSKISNQKSLNKIKIITFSSPKVTITPISIKQKLMYEEECLTTRNLIMQEYNSSQELLSVCGSVTTDMRSPKCSISFNSTSLNKPQNSQQKIVGVKKLNECNSKYFNHNIEIIQLINSQLQNQTLLASTIIKLQ